MTYGIFLNLDQRRWRNADYSTTDLLTGTIFIDENQTTPKDLTGYTITIRFLKKLSGTDHFGKVATIVNALNGTWSYAVKQGDIPQAGIYTVEAELSNATSVITNLNEVNLTILPS